MIDYKEKLLSQFSTSLISAGYSGDDSHNIGTLLLLLLDEYELSERSTDIALLDDSNDKLVQMFIGIILTEGKSKRTAREYFRVVNRFVHDIGKDIPDISTSDIRLWLAKEQNRVSASTVESERAYLSSFFACLYNEELIEKNPMAKIKPIKFTKPVKKDFTDLEIYQMRNVDMPLRVRAELEILLTSGLRADELCNLNIDDIDFQDSSVYVRCGKGNKSRKSYLNTISIKQISKYIESRKDDRRELFLTRNGERLTYSTLSRDLKMVGQAANISDVRPHKFRHTFATNLHKRGMPIGDIQLLLGHTNTDTTMRYIGISDDETKIRYEMCM